MHTKIYKNFEYFFAEKKRILIALNQTAHFDELLCAAVLKELFAAYEIPSTIVCDHGIDQTALAFLDTEICLQTNILPEMITEIILNNFDQTEQIEITRAKKKKNAQTLLRITHHPDIDIQKYIHITSKKAAYDLIVCINIQTLSDLGELYTNNISLFSETEILTLTKNKQDTISTQYVIADDTAQSCCALLYRVLHSLGAEFFTQKIAEQLLTGILANTQGFAEQHMHPNTLQISAQLMKYGADRNKIIKNIFHTKSLATVRLWGHILSKITFNSEKKLLHTMISTEDLHASGARIEHIADIIPEILLQHPETETILLTYPQDKKNVCEAIVYSTNNNAKTLTKQFNTIGSDQKCIVTISDKNLEQAHKTLVQTISIA